MLSACHGRERALSASRDGRPGNHQRGGGDVELGDRMEHIRRAIVRMAAKVASLKTPNAELTGQGARGMSDEASQSSNADAGPVERPVVRPVPKRAEFARGDLVRKRSGSQWQGRVVGEYCTTLTPEGYAVESDAHAGSVQIYPAAALELVDRSKTPNVGGNRLAPTQEQR